MLGSTLDVLMEGRAAGRAAFVVVLELVDLADGVEDVFVLVCVVVTTGSGLNFRYGLAAVVFLCSVVVFTCAVGTAADDKDCSGAGVDVGICGLNFRYGFARAGLGV